MKQRENFNLKEGSVVHIQIPLTGYVDRILCSSAVATTSSSTV